MSREAEILVRPYSDGTYRGPDTAYTVILKEDGKVVETRVLPNKTLRYAEDLAENWESEVIK